MKKLNTWNRFWVVILSGILVTASVEAKTKRSPSQTRPQDTVGESTPKEEPSADEHAVELSGHRSSKTLLGIGGAYAMLDGESGYGGHLQLLFEATDNFYIGVESGLFFFTKASSFGVVSGSGDLWHVPILATLLYKFDVPGADSFHPYIGIAGGIGLDFLTYGITVSSFSSSTSKTKVYANGMGRLGAAFRMGPSTEFYIEGQAGILREEFLLTPGVGLLFRL